MSVDAMVTKLVGAFRKDPRNKVLVGFELLLASASEETGKAVKADVLSKVLSRYVNGSAKEADEALYDGAVAVCGPVARSCFGDNPDDDVDYNIEWIENADGTFTAEVRPS